MVGAALPVARGLSSMHAPSLWVVLGLAYLVGGVVMACHLGRLGHGAGTTCASLVVWPLLLGLVGRPPAPPLVLARRSRRSPRPSGPNEAAIERAVARLGRALEEDALDPDDDGAGVGLLDPDQLASLAAALHRADRRIARVDRLLAEVGEHERLGPRASAPGHDSAQLAATLAKLRRARAHAQAELDAVLAGLVSLRLQLGMFTLAGEVEPVRERLAELEARVAALAELSSVQLAQVSA